METKRGVRGLGLRIVGCFFGLDGGLKRILHEGSRFMQLTLIFSTSPQATIKIVLKCLAETQEINLERGCERLSVGA